MHNDPRHPAAPRRTGRSEFLTTRLDAIANWIERNKLASAVEKNVVNRALKYSLWPLPFATACCGIEFMAVAASRFDMARFGAEAVRFSPRQADMLVVAGRVATKMMPVLQRIYLQMCEPKWVISMGACASTGGVFDTYAVIQGIDQFMPVDVYVPGCPPRPETLLEGIMLVQRIVQEHGLRTSSERGMGLRLTVGKT